MKSLINLASIFFISLLIQSCSDKNPTSSEDTLNKNVFYYNTFETDKDTTGWTGLSKNMFADDPCPENGKRSIHIGGGCPQPAASIELPSLNEGYYKFSFWGKMGQQSQSAQVILKASDNTDESKNLVIGVYGTDWKSYQSQEKLYVPANKKLSLEIWVGGIVLADVYIDNLKIEKAKSVQKAGVYENIIGMFK